MTSTYGNSPDNEMLICNEPEMKACTEVAFTASEMILSAMPRGQHRHCRQPDLVPGRPEPVGNLGLSTAECLSRETGNLVKVNPRMLLLLLLLLRMWRLMFQTLAKPLQVITTHINSIHVKVKFKGTKADNFFHKIIVSNL